MTAQVFNFMANANTAEPWQNNSTFKVYYQFPNTGQSGYTKLDTLCEAWQFFKNLKDSDHAGRHYITVLYNRDNTEIARVEKNV